MTAAHERSNPARRKRGIGGSLVGVWRERSLHPLLGLGVIVGLEAFSAGILVWWAGWHQLVHAVSVGNAEWFALAIVGLAVAYVGYFKAVASGDRGIRLSFPVSLGLYVWGSAPCSRLTPTVGSRLIASRCAREALAPEALFTE